MVHRANAIICNLISTWYGNEYISEFLGGLHLVYTVVIGCNDFHSIRYHNAFQRLVLAHHPSINCASLSGLNSVRDNECSLSLLLYSRSPAYRYGVCISKKPFKKGNCYVLGRNVDNFAIMFLSCGVSENHDICFLWYLAEHYPELHQAIRSGLNFRGDVKLYIQGGVVRLFLTRNKSQSDNRQRKKFQN